MGLPGHRPMGGARMIRLQFEIVGPDFEEASKRQINEARKHAAQKAFEYLKEQMPKRFDGSLKGELRMATRSSKWEATKGKIRPGSRGIPLLFTGKSQRRAEKATIKVGNRSSMLVISGLDEAFGRRMRTSRRNRQELSGVTRREEYVMGEIWTREMAKKLNELLGKTKKTEAL